MDKHWAMLISTVTVLSDQWEKESKNCRACSSISPMPARPEQTQHASIWGDLEACVLQ